MMQFNIQSIEHLDAVSNYIVSNMKNYKTFCFFGNLGAGKTTLINNICQKLQITDEVSSPTFSIIQEYKYGKDIICHIDLYRVNAIEEAIDIGIEDYLYHHICFVEWADNFIELMPLPYMNIQITQIDDKRIIDINVVN
jgi:tRNA threonylcarbamoyladenosine biosynthesis protein TsaE